MFLSFFFYYYNHHRTVYFYIIYLFIFKNEIRHKNNKQILSTKLQWNAKPKIGSLDNAHHKPGGGDKKIEEVKLDFKEKAKPKIGSLENAQHVPKGGDVKVR